MSLEALTARGEKMHQDLGREWYLVGAGLKSNPEFQQLYQRYADLTSPEVVAEARSAGTIELFEWAADLAIGRRTAALEEAQITWETGAVLRVGEREIPYLRAPIDMANTPDREFRIALDAARLTAVEAGLNGIRRERFAVEREDILALGLGDYVHARATLSGLDLDALGRAAGAFLVRTADAYRDSLARVVRQRLGIAVGDLVRSDAAWAFRSSQFDAAFRPTELVAMATRQMGEIGIDPVQGGRIRFDTDERPGKQPRAFCAPVQVPDEVYLVLRPRGGHQDYRTFWHEHGHALHFGSVDPAQSFAAKWLGDNSVTEGFAMLWDHMTLETGWLTRFAGLSPRDARTLRFELGVSELFMARRYAAKLGYELRLHRGSYEGRGAEYAERLSEATLFRYPEGDYLADVDPGFYAARYLRAWQLQAAMGETLRERFDEDWFRNPRAGGFIQHLMSSGQAENADRLSARVTGGPLDFEPLVRQLEAALA
ncbi:MAG: hypothetical protein EXR93_02615 [Gemmatimonadetes bacterium]|nr:hypothetical protein [Gemmatimonadota bacterium]